MFNLQIDDQLAEQLRQAAERQGRTPDDLAEQAIAVLLHHESAPAPELTDEQKAHIMRGIAQLDRGEMVPSEEVDAFFEEWFAELEKR